MGPLGSLETSVSNYHHSLRNNPEERTSQLHRGGSLKLHLVASPPRKKPKYSLNRGHVGSGTCLDGFGNEKELPSQGFEPQETQFVT